MKTLYYHTSRSCAPCKKLKPMAREVTDAAGAKFVEIDIDNEPTIIPGIMSVPTVVISEPGKEKIVLGPSQVRKVTLRELLAGN